MHRLLAHLVSLAAALALAPRGLPQPAGVRPEPTTMTAPSAPESTRFSYQRGINISHWLSQNSPNRPYAAPWFTEDDVAWIAAQGFDHLRLPVDGRLWLRDDGSLDEAKLEPFERAWAWARARGLGTILDMHFLPGADFNPMRLENTLFTDPATLDRVSDFWGRVAARYADAGPDLRFELLNEPVAAENAQLNPVNRALLAAIRRTNPTRIVYLTSNRWGGFGTVGDLEVPDDPAVAITLHFYEPFVFTHQRARWTGFGPDMPLVPFPGRVPVLDRGVPPDHWIRGQEGQELTVAEHIDAPFARLAQWARAHAPGKEIHIGEFGAYEPADPDSRRAWIAAVRAACERHGFGWAVWDYRGGFAVRDAQGKPTPVLEGLFPPKPAAP
jgi:endoglucanase